MPINMKCPTCGGPVYFDPQSRRMKCRYCGNETGIGRFSQYDSDFDVSPDEAEEYMEVKEYRCTSCGARLMLNGTEASTFCGFCGSPTIVYERVASHLRPQKIIPFKITEEQALDSVKKTFQKGKYIPGKIQELTVEKVRGIYIPYWLYDSRIRRSMILEVWHKRERKYYDRDASCVYKQLTMDASLNLINAFSRRLEPYYMNDLVKFDPTYLSGFYADVFDVPKDAVASDARQRCRDFLDAEIIKTCPEIKVNDVGNGQFDNYRIAKVDEKYEVLQIEYALLPAYFINISYKEGNELVLVNGQTGKVVGNLPIEKGQIAKMYVKYAVAAGILFFGLYLLGMIRLGDDDPVATVYYWVMPGITAFLSILRGVSSYSKYKRDRLRINVSNMREYVDDREGELG